MSFKIDFDIDSAISKVGKLSQSMDAVGNKATKISGELKVVAEVINAGASSHAKLKEAAEKSAKGQVDALKGVVEQVRNLSGANGESAQKLSVAWHTATNTLKEMKKQVDSANASAVEGAKKGNAAYGDQTLAIKKAADAAQLYANKLNKTGTELAELSAWQKRVASKRALQKEIDDAIQLRKDLNKTGTELAELSAWQKRVASKRALQKEIDDAIQLRKELNKTGTELAELSAWQKRVASKRALQKEIDDAIQLRKELNKTGTELAELSAWQKRVAEQRALKKAADDAAAYAKKLNEAGTEAAALKKWQDGIAAGRAAGSIPSSTALGAIAPKTTKAVTELTTSFNRSAQGAAAMRAALNAAGTHMGIFTGQTIATAAAVFSVVTAFKTMVSTGIDYTGQMARAIPIMGASAEQAKMLELQVRNLGETTKFTAVEAAGGLTALAMAGLSTQQALESLPSALHLASIGQVDMYKSADILTNVMNGFRLSAEQVPSIVDDLATAVTTSNATIEQMAGALSYVAPVATAAGGSIEEVTAILEVFHNAGIKGTRAGTSLRRAYSNLMKPSEGAVKVLGELGIVTKDSNGYLLEMSDIMRQLANKGALASDVIELFGVRAAPAMLALLQDLKGVTSEFEIFRANLENNEGAAENLAKKMEDFLGDDLRKMFSALTEQALRFFDESKDGLRQLTQEATAFIRSFSIEDIKKLADTMKWLGQVVVGVGAAYAALKVAQGTVFALSSGIWLLNDAIKVYRTAQAAATVTTVASTAALSSTAAATTAAAAATTGLGAAIRFALGPIGVALTVVGGLAYAYDQYTSSASEAVKEVNKLTDAERKLAALRDSGADKAKAAIEFVKGGGTSEQDRVEVSLNEKIKDLEAKRDSYTQAKEALVEAFVTSPEKFGTGRAEIVSNYDKSLAVVAKQAKDTSNQIKKVRAELDQYLTTGIDEQGRRGIERTSAALAKLDKVTFSKESAAIVKSLGNELKELGSISKAQGGTAAGLLIGSQEEINEAIAALEIAYQKKLKPLQDKLKATGRQTTKQGVLGGYANAKEYLATEEKINALTVAKDAAVESLNGKLQQVNSTYATYIQSNDEFLATGISGLEVLKSQIAALEGETKATKTSTDMKMLARQTQIEMNITALEGVEGKENEVKKLKEQLAATKELIAETKNLKSSLEEAKVAAKLKDDFESGKYLSKDDKAQQEYDAGVAQLDEYIRIGKLKSDEDERYVNAKLELDQKLKQSQHEVWYDLAEDMSKSVGDNIAKAALLEQTWEETSDNIKRAVIGGIVGSLVQAGTEYLTTMLLDSLFTTQKTTNDSVKATSGVVAATTETAAIQTLTQAKMMDGIVGQSGGDPYSAFFRMAAMTAIMAGVQGVVGGIMGNVNGTREIGGPVSANQSYLVGEKGAEVFTPTTAGAITSNADVKRSLGGSGGGVTNVYNTYEGDTVSIKALDTQDVRRALAKESRYINALNAKEDRRSGIAKSRS